jgi:hypothetical protein
MQRLVNVPDERRQIVGSNIVGAHISGDDLRSELDKMIL